MKILAKLFYDAKIVKREYGNSEHLRKKFDEKRWKLINSASKISRNITRIMNYIMTFDGQWFTFVQYENVEPISNIAKSALGRMVIKRRASKQNRGKDKMDCYLMQMLLYITSKL